jgi:hypothetical protein
VYLYDYKNMYNDMHNCGQLLYGQIDSNLEVCISNFHVYGTVTLAVNVTVNSGASHLQGNHLASAVRRSQRPTTSPTVISS